jgi:glycosyltransferase involved in cell wall biosynthesis
MGVICVIIERTIKPDIIYVRNKLIAFSLLMLKLFVSKPIVFKFDNFAADEVLPAIKQKQFRNVIGKMLWTIDYYTLRHADLLLVHSNVMKNSIVEKSSIEDHKILICPPGIDMKKIEIIKESDVPSLENRVRIGFLGSLAWWQGVDILAEAVTMVKEKLPHVELFIVGDGPMREKATKICEKHKIKCIITGFVPHEKALKYLKSFDVLVLPRRKTPATESNIPIKVMEAWALGVPVIVTSHEVFKYMCKDGEHVVFVEPNPEDVAEKILLLALNSELRERLARNGQTLAQSFDYKTIAEGLLTSILQSE